MFENDVLKIYREVGALKHDLLSAGEWITLEDQAKYLLATKIDLAVSRLIRLMDKKGVTTP